MNGLGLAGTLLVLLGYAAIAVAQGAIAPATGSPAPLFTAQVTGTAFYRERIVLPAGAVFEARIEDVSEADAVPSVLGRVVLPDPGNPPFEFAIDYDPSLIDPSARFVVRARVTVGDILVFTSDTAHPVITGGAPGAVEVLMRMVAEPSAAVQPPTVPGSLELPATLVGTLDCADCPRGAYRINLWPDGVFHLSRTPGAGQSSADRMGRWSADPRRPTLVLRSGTDVWRFDVVDPDRLRLVGHDGAPLAEANAATELRVTPFEPLQLSLAMRGMMSFEAGEPLFQECLTGRDYAIADEGDFKSLEHAFLTGGGPSTLASFDATLIERGRRAPDGPPPEVKIVRFLGVWPEDTCEKGTTEATLVNTNWKIVRLGPNDMPAAEGREPMLQLASPEARFAASAGCNELAGTYTLDGMRLTFGPVSATRMACPAPLADRESRLIAALSDVAGWRISGEVLELRNAADEVLVMLRAVPRP